jgi:hypothetical protein
LCSQVDEELRVMVRRLGDVDTEKLAGVLLLADAIHDASTHADDVHRQRPSAFV